MFPHLTDTVQKRFIRKQNVCSIFLEDRPLDLSTEKPGSEGTDWTRSDISNKLLSIEPNGSQPSSQGN